MDTISEKLVLIAENEPKVYNKGRNDEWSDFWESIDEDNIGAYNFSGSAWNDKTFKPKFNIVPKSCASFFANNNVTDLNKILIDCGVILDTQNSSSFGYSFYNCQNLTLLPTINYSKVTTTSQMTNTISGCPSLARIGGIVFPEDYTVHSATVNVLTNLPELRAIGTIEGKIKFNLNLSKSSKLNATNIQKIVNALYDYKTNGGNTYGATITFHQDVGISDDEKTEIANKGWEVM